MRKLSTFLLTSTFLNAAELALPSIPSDSAKNRSFASSALVPAHENERASYSVERTYALICEYMGGNLGKIQAFHTGLRIFAPRDVHQKEEMRKTLNLVVYKAFRQRMSVFLLNVCDPENRFMSTQGAISALVLDVFLGKGINGGMGMLIPAFGSAATVFDKVMREAGYSELTTKRVAKEQISFIADFYRKVDRKLVGVTAGIAAEEIDRTLALWGSDSEGGDFGGIIQNFFESLALKMERSFFVDAIGSAQRKADYSNFNLDRIASQISENERDLAVAKKNSTEKGSIVEQVRGMFSTIQEKDAQERSWLARTARDIPELAAARATKKQAEAELSEVQKACQKLSEQIAKLAEEHESTSTTLRETSEFREILLKFQADGRFLGTEGNNTTRVVELFGELTDIESQRLNDVRVHNTPSEATEIVKEMLGSVLGVNVSDVSIRLRAELTTAVPITLAYGQEQVVQQVKIFNKGKEVASRVATGRNALFVGGLAAVAGVVDHFWNDGKGRGDLMSSASDVWSNPTILLSSVGNFGMQTIKEQVVYPTVQEFTSGAPTTVSLLGRVKSAVDAGRTTLQGASMAGAGIALLKLAGTYLPGALGNRCAYIPNALSVGNIPAGYVAPFDLPTGSLLTSWGLGLFSAYCQNPEGIARLVNGVLTGIKRLIGNIGYKELLIGGMYVGTNYVLTNLLVGDDASAMGL